MPNILVEEIDMNQYLTSMSIIKKTLLAIMFVPLAAFAQEWPNKPITFLVPFPAGGGTDAFARPLATQLTKQLGKQIVIDNRGGAGGNIGTTVGANAKPDGYTFTFVNQGTMVFNPLIYPNPGYKVDQFNPVSLLASIDLIICANPSVPANTMTEFIELAKKNPGKYTYGTAGNGSGNHMAGVLLEDLAKIDITHVPYKGGGPAVIDFISGVTQVMITNISTLSPQVQAGKARALAHAGCGAEALCEDRRERQSPLAPTESKPSAL